MIIASPLLGQLGAASGGAMPQQGDDTITVPPIVFNANKIPFPAYKTPQVAAGDAGPNLQLGSFITGHVYTRAAGGGLQSTLIATLPGGFWNIDLAYNYRLSALQTGFTMYATYGDPAVGMNTFVIFDFTNQGSAQTSISTCWWQTEMLIPKGYECRMFFDWNNSGGTTLMFFSYNLNVRRYL